MGTFKYKLPGDIDPVEYETANNALIIIGANGSGKSKLGAWIENTDTVTIHRIGAQRKLVFNNNLDLKSLDVSQNLITHGEKNNNNDRKAYRWDHGRGYTTTMHDDYGYVLSALFAKMNLENASSIKQVNEIISSSGSYNKNITNIGDKFIKIWDQIFSHCAIKFSDSSVFAKNLTTDACQEFSAATMSDGERTVLYLIAQCLVLPDAIKTIIIDEPELHLHRSIMNKLWLLLEEAKPECLFIYITHDTQFAANHQHAQKIWVKSFDGSNKWELHKIEESDLPDELLLNLLGNRKKVIFVEGSSGSYDTQLYKEIYKNHYIVPCGSCHNVILWTRAMRSNSCLHHIEAFGIIDRDYRTDGELEIYSRDNVFSLQVAEVENLFIVEEVLAIIEDYMTVQGAVEKIKKYIIDERFSGQKNRQIINSFFSEYKYKMGCAIKIAGDEEKTSSLIESIDKDAIKNAVQELFDNCVTYAEILRIFNEKSLVTSVGQYFGLDNKQYASFVLGILKKENMREKTIKALSPYLPSEIPLDVS